MPSKTQASIESSSPFHPPSPSAFPAPAEQPNILIVEDENLVRRNLRAIIQRSGFRVTEAETGEQGMELFKDTHPSAVVLDIMLPGIDGFEVCRRIREINAKVAILILTAKNQDPDKIRGLEDGADDYMVKPFNPDELIARLKAVLRRSQDRSGSSEVLHFGPFRIDLQNRKCFKGDTEIPLSPKELSLLSVFFQNPGRTLSREELRQWLWGKQHFGSDKGLDVYIRKLREKIELDPSRPHHLKTAWGTGYIWK